MVVILYNNGTTMKYYYLNEEKKPQGPYTKEQLLQFKASGLINDNTLAAVAGERSWKSLREVLQQATCSTWNNEIFCPHCKQEIDEEKTPEICPHCHKMIQGHNRNLWGVFVYGLKNTFNFKGRATRTEFWGFYLFYCIISYAFSQVMNLFTLGVGSDFQAKLEASTELQEIIPILMEYMSNPTIIVTTIINCIVSLAIFIAFISVSVRRLHDTGTSGVPVLIACIFTVLFYMAAGHFAYVIYDLFVIKHIVDFSSEIVQETLTQVAYEMMVSLLVLCVVSIYLFVKMCMESYAGSNQYGPASIYPRKKESN